MRSLFTPIQPAGNSDEVCYRELLPDDRLSSLVYCYWQLRSHADLDHAFTYRVVPDGCIDVYFDLGGDGHGFVTGFASTYINFPLEGNFNYAGIRFFPGSFPLLFNVKASEIADASFDLRLVLTGIAGDLEDTLTGKQDLPAIAHIFDQFLLRRMGAMRRHVDHRFTRALGLILEKAGSLHVQHDLDTGISPRQLRRLFDFYIGDSPKTFSRVVRFQRYLRLFSDKNGKNNKTLLPDLGYFDQAHFIKEFRILTGYTPSTFPPEAFVKN